VNKIGSARFGKSFALEVGIAREVAHDGWSRRHLAARAFLLKSFVGQDPNKPYAGKWARPHPMPLPREREPDLAALERVTDQ